MGRRKPKKAPSVMEKGEIVVTGHGKGRGRVVTISNVLSIRAINPKRLILSVYRPVKRGMIRRLVTPKDGVLYAMLLGLYLAGIETGGKHEG